MKDLLGGKFNFESEFICFHDESKCEKSNFLYHGFLFVRRNQIEERVKKLIELKKTYYERYKEIHFTKCRNSCKERYGRKTKTAIEWLKSAKNWLAEDKVKFYLFGINTNNIKNFWDNRHSYEHNIYIRFFEIGLKSAIRWFSKYEEEEYNKKFILSHLFFDPNSEFNEKRKEKVKYLSYELDKEDYFEEISREKVEKLDSDEKESEKEMSNLIQLTDVLIGVNRVAFVEIGNSAEGQQECLDEFIDIIEHFTDESKAYNPDSAYYKKFTLQFFPTKDKGLTKEELMKKDKNYYRKRGNFYLNRKTYRQQKQEEAQLSFSF